MFKKATYSDLPEFKFGHAQETQAGTGCTVVLAPLGATAAASISGGGPATRETDLLKPENMIESVHALVLSGGSAFGLEASCGVMDALAERKIGFSLGEAFVPIVCGASLFDLLVGENTAPDKAMGYAAVQTAFEDRPFGEGNVGAGTGASVGKLLGPQNAMKSGFGMSFLKHEDLVVGALVAVNAVGNVMDASGAWMAGCHDGQGNIIDSTHALIQAAQAQSFDQKAATPPTNTTLGIVVTNAKLTKAQATKVSSLVDDAYARAIKPVHTSNDGDAIFTFASKKVDALPDLVGTIACEAMEDAIRRAIKTARSAYGLPALHDLRKKKQN